MITNTAVAPTRDVEVLAVYRAVRTFSASYPRRVLNTKIITLRETGTSRINIGLDHSGLGLRVTSVRVTSLSPAGTSRVISATTGLGTGFVCVCRRSASSSG